MIVYIFDCPIHGEEVTMFCSWAAQPHMADRWKKIDTTQKEKEIPMSPEEVKQYVETIYIGGAKP